jgi:hypothetical protein
MAGGGDFTGVGAGRTVPVIAPGRGEYTGSIAYENELAVDVGM